MVISHPPFNHFSLSILYHFYPKNTSKRPQKKIKKLSKITSKRLTTATQKFILFRLQEAKATATARQVQWFFVLK
jgi:hypothetical protein